MANIQKTLDSLQPYVIGIRYLEGMQLVDAVFKDGWTIPDDSLIKKLKGDESLNYYMIFSEDANVGIDELLAYVERVIKLNIDKEKKHELLKAKVNELKDIFKNNTLIKLKTLKFSFGEEDLMPSIDEFNIEETPIEEIIMEEKPLIPKTPIDIIESTPKVYVDENKNPIELTEEDKEILEEEARAARNLKIMEAKKKTVTTTNIAKKVELPPKREIKPVIQTNENPDCECGPDEACEKCINLKDY